MPAYKDSVTGTWFVKFYSKNWTGENRQIKKRGFATKREALEFERNYKVREECNLDMTFENFFKLYSEDIMGRLKRNTWLTKEHIIRTKILPYFQSLKMNEISASDVLKWQNEMIAYRDENGVGYSETYRKTMHNQLSCLFNHACRYYNLKSNPARKAGCMGKEESKEMLFWTKEEYKKFSEAIMDKEISFYSFEMLYWTGIRLGELLALTMEDFDFTKNTVRINKSYQRLEKQDLVTTPKTPKSKRTIKLPKFLVEEMKEYFAMLYEYEKENRIFPVTKSYLHHEMERGCKSSKVKKIRIHDLRHSHISLLIDMGFSAVAIADRVGHESIDITYQLRTCFRRSRLKWRISWICKIWRWKTILKSRRRRIFNMSERRCDTKNRWRNVVVAFRMSPQEAEDLNVKVALSGLSKQDYLIDSCLKHEIRVVCGKKVAKKMQVYLEAILEELQFMEEGVVPEDEILAPLQHILEIVNKDEEKEDLDYGTDII